jgi:uncharacterized protein (UPF0261 family)
MVPKIVIAGILDTKGRELRYLAEQVKAAGGEPVIMELSLSGECGWADIGLGEVLKTTGHSVADVAAVNRSDASKIVLEASGKMVRALYREGKLHGMIGYGGSMGALVASAAMRALPIGVPKLLLTTASGTVRNFSDGKDLCVMYAVSEAGINRVTKRILGYAAAGIVAMAAAPWPDISKCRPLIGCMMQGMTTPCVLRASRYFEEHGYDIIINHATGAGGKSMEDMIAEGQIVGLLDLTTHELTTEFFAGKSWAGPERLRTAARVGVPQVVAPGGMANMIFAEIETVPKQIIEDWNSGLRGYNRHNVSVNSFGLKLEEIKVLGRAFVERLGRAKAPAVVLVPLRGWSASDLAGPNKALGRTAAGPGPFWIPDPMDPERSLRSKYFIDAMAEAIREFDIHNDNFEILAVDKHLNETDFANLAAELLAEMLAGNWKKGSHAGLPFVKRSPM